MMRVLANRSALNAEQLATIYETAQPFKHIVIDDFLDDVLWRQAARGFPPVDSDFWLQYRSGRENRKQQSRDVALLPSPLSHLLRWANGEPFLRWLSIVTRHDNLLADVHYSGGGLHQTRRGGHLSVHTDFPRHQRNGWLRRLNAILFLNEDWRPDWGGALEFWNEDMTRAVRSIDPIANRLVVFETNAISWHGHPNPLRCPESVTRKSIATYYYVADDADRPAPPWRGTRFLERPGERFRPTWRDRAAAVRSLLPGRGGRRACRRAGEPLRAEFRRRAVVMPRAGWRPRAAPPRSPPAARPMRFSRHRAR